MFPFFFYFYYFLVVLGLCCWAWTFCSWGERGLLSICSMWTSHCSSLSCYGSRALGLQASVVVAHGLSCPRHVGSSWTRDQNGVPSIERWILKLTTKEGPGAPLLTATPPPREFLFNLHEKKVSLAFLLSAPLCIL